MSSMDIECKGCRCHDSNISRAEGVFITCSIPPVIEDVECPCLTCLITGICKSYIDCDLHNKFLHIARKWINENK